MSESRPPGPASRCLQEAAPGPVQQPAGAPSGAGTQPLAAQERQKAVHSHALKEPFEEGGGLFVAASSHEEEAANVHLENFKVDAMTRRWWAHAQACTHVHTHARGRAPCASRAGTHCWPWPH